MSTSAWGSELKYSIIVSDIDHATVSTSAWGSELKLWFRIIFLCNQGLPLREVVSWNDIFSWHHSLDMSLPLREVVSWNLTVISKPAAKPSLPLREVVSWNILKAENNLLKCVSTSAWGSELKCPDALVASDLSGLPLREVVSWNIKSSLGFPVRTVYLCVR